MYNWADVASRTEAVYTAALLEPHSAALAPRLPRLLACGRFYGLLVVAFAALGAFWHAVVCWLDPEDQVELAGTFNVACTSVDGVCTAAPASSSSEQVITSAYSRERRAGAHERSSSNGDGGKDVDGLQYNTYHARYMQTRLLGTQHTAQNQG
jgi:hypothetical protein